MSNKEINDDLTLPMQNPNGGYGTWELARTYPWMEASFQLTHALLTKHT